MTREELLTSKEYWVSTLQLDLYNKIKDYLSENDLSQTQLAEKLNVTKGYISQVLNGDFDHKMSKMIELSLACDRVPLVFFVDKAEFIANDARDKVYELFPVQRLQNMVYEHTPVYSAKQEIINRTEDELAEVHWQSPRTTGSKTVFTK